MYSLFVGEAFFVFAINDEIVVLDTVFDFLNREGNSWYIGSSMFSSGRAPGPLWTLFVVILYKLGLNSITGILFFMVVLNTASIYLVHRLSLFFFSPQFALLTSLLFATSPWAIYYSVGIYNPMPVIFFGALLLLSLWKTISIDQSKSIFWVCILAAAIPQFHMITLFFYPAGFLLLWMFKTKLNIKYFILGTLIGVSFYLPYIIGEVLNNWQNTRMILTGEDKTFSFSVLKVISAPITVLSNAPGDWIGREADPVQGYKNFGTNYFFHYSILLTINLINLVFLLVMWFKFAVAGIKSVKHFLFSSETNSSEQKKLVFLTIVILTPLIFFLITGRNFSTRYTLAMLSPLFIMLVFMVLRIQNSKYMKWVTTYLLINIIFSVYIVISHNNYKSILIHTSETFLPSLFKLEEIQQSINTEIPDSTYIHINLSKAIINTLESQQKLYRALVSFIELGNKNKNKLTAETKELMLIKKNEPYNKSRYQKVLYDSPSIMLLE